MQPPYLVDGILSRREGARGVGGGLHVACASDKISADGGEVGNEAVDRVRKRVVATGEKDLERVEETAKIGVKGVVGHGMGSGEGEVSGVGRGWPRRGAARTGGAMSGSGIAGAAASRAKARRGEPVLSHGEAV